MSYVRPVLRWSWVTILLIVGVVAVILYYNANLPVQYTSTVKLQASAPEADDVTLYSSVRTGTTREEISTVQSDFQSIVRSPTAAQTTVKQLGLQMPWLEFLSHVRTEVPLYSDFVLVHVTQITLRMPKPSLACIPTMPSSSMPRRGRARLWRAASSSPNSYPRPARTWPTLARPCCSSRSSTARPT